MRAIRNSTVRIATPFWLDLALALVLTVVVELEVLLGPASGGSRWVTAVAAAVVTLALAWRRSVPLLPLVVAGMALPAQASLGGFLVESPVTPLAALALALYSAGRHVVGARSVAAAVIALGALAATRIAFDPAAEAPAQAILTLVVVPLPFLVGRSVRGQVLLRRELDEKAERLAREREREGRHAAEEERVRIATDLQAVVAAGLRVIIHQAQELPSRLIAEDRSEARAMLASITGTARETLTEVRRVLGILRHDRQAPPLAPVGDLVDGAHTSPAAPATPDRASPVTAAAASSQPPSQPLAGRDGSRLDRMLVATLLAGAEIELAVIAPPGARVIAALSAVAIVAPLIWRRRRPVAVAVVVLGAVSAQSAVVSPASFPVFDIAALICATYAIGAHAGRGLALAGLGLAAVGAAAHAVAFHPDAVAQGLFGGVVVPWTVGRTLRNQRLLTHALEEKAARVQHASEHEERAAVTGERARVARELHDVVAHSISVIAIQAGGADGILERDPERVARCAALIESVARDALAELDRVLGAPSIGDGGSAGPPQRLARVERLARRARDTGLAVEVRVEGEPATLPAGVDLAAYRIVQEALANTSKHAGDARARVVVRYGEHDVEVEVSDDGLGANGREPARAGGGHGLTGMRERVALYGGELEAGRRPSGGFMVRARLPIGSA